MLKNNLLKLVSLSILTSALIACGGSSDNDDQNTNSSDVEEQSSTDNQTDANKMAVAFAPQFTAYFNQVARKGVVPAKRTAEPQKMAANSSYSGTLVATNADTGNTQTFDWYVKVDNDGNIVSQKNISLSPGTYSFSMLLEGGGYQYGGDAQNVALADGDTQNIAIVIKPIVGGSISNIELLDTMADISFTINSADLLAANIEDPRMGIIIDSGDEQIFSIDKTTGAPSALVSLPDGEYTVEVNFYDGNKLIGHTLDTQETLSFTNGQKVLFDIISLQADISFTFTEGVEDSSAFKINVPGKIVEKVSDISTLKAHLKFAGDEFVEQMLDVEQVGDNYVASTELNIGVTDKGTLSITLDFLDTSLADNNVISGCTGSINLQSASNTIACPLELENTYIAGGKLLGTLAINVLQKNGDDYSSVSGAEVFVNGESIGLTDGEILATPGYIKAHRQKGDYTIRVEAGDRAATKAVSLDPLEVKNLDITLLSPSGTGAGDNPGTGGSDNPGTGGSSSGSSIGGGIVYVDGPGCGEAAPTNSNLQPSEYWVQIASQTAESQMSTCVDQKTYSWLRKEDTKFMVAYPKLGIHYVFDLFKIRRSNYMNCSYLPETLPSFATPNLFWKEAQCSDSGSMTAFSLQTLAGQWCETVAMQAPALNINGANYGSRTSGSACNLYIQRYPDPYATLLPSTNSGYYADVAYGAKYNNTYDMLVDDAPVVLRGASNFRYFGNALDKNVTTYADSAGTYMAFSFTTPMAIKRFEIVNPRGLVYSSQIVRIAARVPGKDSVWTILGAYTLPRDENVMLQIPENDYGALSEYALLYSRAYDTTSGPRVSTVKAYTY